MRLVSQIKMPVPDLRNGSQRNPSAHSSATRISTSPFGMVGDHTRRPKRTWLNTEPPRLAMPCTLFDFDALALRQQSEHLGDHDDALPADADDKDVECVIRAIARHGRRTRPSGGMDGGDRISHCITGATVLMQSTVQTCAHSVQPIQSDWSIWTLWRPSNDWSLQVMAGQPRFMHA